MDSLLDSYDVEIFLDVNEPVDSVNLETVLKLDNSRYKDTINFTRSLQEKDKIKIHFEDYDI